MPKKICNQVGCNTLISMQERYCAEHIKDKKVHDSMVAKRYNETLRNKKHERFYSSGQWKKVRTHIMSRYGGLCRSCAEFDMDVRADVVDHIVPIEINWELKINFDNLQPLCHSCHNRKTADDKKKYGGRV